LPERQVAINDSGNAVSIPVSEFKMPGCHQIGLRPLNPYLPTLVV